MVWIQTGLQKTYIPDFARDYYQYIWEATEELREEIRLMSAVNKTPKDFGLKVRHIQPLSELP